MKKLVFLVVVLTAFSVGVLKAANVFDAHSMQEQSNIALVQTQQAPIAVPVIMYHSIYSKREGRFIVTPAQFEKDLIFLKGKGYETILPNDLVKFNEDTSFQLPKKPIMITFDDGNYNVMSNAMPILEKHNMKAVAFVVGKFSHSRKQEVPSNSFSHLSWAELNSMQKSKVFQIGNHTWDLHKIDQNRSGARKNKGEAESCYQTTLLSDLTKLQNVLKEKSDINCTSFAWPFGMYSKEATTVFEKLGIKTVFICTEGINYFNRGDSLMQIKRFNRPSGLSAEQFFSSKKV